MVSPPLHPIQHGQHGESPSEAFPSASFRSLEFSASFPGDWSWRVKRTWFLFLSGLRAIVSDRIWPYSLRDLNLPAPW